MMLTEVKWLIYSWLLLRRLHGGSGLFCLTQQQGNSHSVWKPLVPSMSDCWLWSDFGSWGGEA